MKTYYIHALAAHEDNSPSHMQRIHDTDDLNAEQQRGHYKQKQQTLPKDPTVLTGAGLNKGGEQH